MKSFFGSVVGAAFGTIAIWLCFFSLGETNPVAILEKYDLIIVDNKVRPRSDDAVSAIELLYRQGLAIPSDSLVSQVSNFYSAVLQISLAAFVLFGFLSFLAIRWQSIQAAEDFADQKVKESLKNYKKSSEFNALLVQKATDVFDVQAEEFDEILESAKQINEFESRLIDIEKKISLASSDAEPSDVEA